MNIKKSLVWAVAVLMLTALLTSISFAWSSEAIGKPTYLIGKEIGYFIWNDDSGWHVRVTTKGALRVFSGTITTDRQIGLASTVNTEEDDKIDSPNSSTLTFQFNCKGGEDGFDFKTTGSYLIFDLKVDGVSAPLQIIYGGSGRTHPKSNPFTIKRNN